MAIAFANGPRRYREDLIERGPAAVARATMAGTVGGADEPGRAEEAPLTSPLALARASSMDSAHSESESFSPGGLMVRGGTRARVGSSDAPPPRRWCDR